MRSDLWFCDICNRKANGNYGKGVDININGNFMKGQHTFTDVCMDCREQLARQVDKLIASLRPTSQVNAELAPPAPPVARFAG